MLSCVIRSLSTRVFETRTVTGREHFACWESIVSKIFILLISNAEKILSNVNVAVCGQVKSENSSLPVTVRVSKTHVLKLPITTSNTTSNKEQLSFLNPLWKRTLHWIMSRALETKRKKSKSYGETGFLRESLSNIVLYSSSLFKCLKKRSHQN